MNRKQEIYLEAARLFRKRGYVATSMNEIADAVGIKAASIYNHFGSKQEILKDLLLEIAQLFSKGMLEVSTSTLNPIEKLESLISLHVRLSVERTNQIAMIVSEWIHLDTESMAAYITMRDEYEDTIKQILVEGKKAGHFKDLDIEIILFSTLSTLRWLYSWYGKNRDYNTIELERQLKSCLLKGIIA